MCRALARVSPKILERLQRPKQDRKTSEELRKETERLANITRYERSLKETRKAIGNTALLSLLAPFFLTLFMYFVITLSIIQLFWLYKWLWLIVVTSEVSNIDFRI